MRTLAITTALLAGCASSGPAAAPATPAPAAAHEGQMKHEGHMNHEGHEGHMSHASGMHHRFENAEEWAKVFDDPTRDAWQQPDAVVAELALTPQMTVADVGAGTGYFTMRIARAVPSGRVFATDIEPDMVHYLGERATKEKLTNVVPVLSTKDAANLAPASVDRILVVDVWHHLADRVAYARTLAAALKPKGMLAIVDFTQEAAHGPPKEFRLPPEALIADLTAVGLTAHLSTTKLPDQFIVVATRP